MTPTLPESLGLRVRLRLAASAVKRSKPAIGAVGTRHGHRLAAAPVARGGWLRSSDPPGRTKRYVRRMFERGMRKGKNAHVYEVWRAMKGALKLTAANGGRKPPPASSLPLLPPSRAEPDPHAIAFSGPPQRPTTRSFPPA